jgi:hypothetical protein
MNMKIFAGCDMTAGFCLEKCQLVDTNIVTVGLTGQSAERGKHKHTVQPLRRW